MLAIIPARGGSKRIPRKNIRMFCGQPMIAYAISAAQESKLFDRVMVSTDDPEIADLASGMGAEVPFVRSIELSDDYATTTDVVANAIEFYERIGYINSHICCIYPCTPFIKVEDLTGALDSLNSSGANYCFPITDFPSPIQRALKQDLTNKLTPLYPQFNTARTQDLEAFYYDVGQFYWGLKEAWTQKNPIHLNSVGYRIPNWRVVDVDTIEDWNRAEIIFKLMEQRDRDGRI